jgi:isopenicillin-N epimerase
MDFYVRHLEPALLSAREVTARFLGTSRPNLVFVENATFGMNVVASSFALESGDEVLLNNHEYGAVHRIWERATRRFGAKVVSAELVDDDFSSTESLKRALISQVTPRTKLVILSHITSATALIWPLSELVRAFQELGVAVCVDGPHAPAHVDLNLDELNCDFYVASLHKWLCGPLGTGFLYVHPRQQNRFEPLLKSWGRLLPAIPEQWDEEFTWSGTRDPSGYLAIPAAIDFLEGVGLETFRGRALWLANYAEQQLVELSGRKPIASRAEGWYGTMAHVPLPSGDWSQLQNQLYSQFKIETPVIHFDQRWFIRVSSHLYTMRTHIDFLIESLRQLGVRSTSTFST